MPKQASRKNMPDEEGIYVEITPAYSGKGVEIPWRYHSYLVYRKADGTTEVLRGGPEQVPKGNPDETRKLIVETGKSLEQSKDKYNPGEQPRPSKKLDIPTDQLDESWGTMTQQVIVVGDAGMKYGQGLGIETEEQTSNSVVRAAFLYSRNPKFPGRPEEVRRSGR